MSDITVITPPDKIFNQNLNIFLLYPSDQIKTDLQNILANSTIKLNVYIYDIQDEHDIDWLLSVQKMSDVTIIDLEKLPTEVKQLESYFVSQSNTYWLTKGENIWYNKLSVNRVYDINFIKDKIGGDKVEKEQQI